MIRIEREVFANLPICLLGMVKHLKLGSEHLALEQVLSLIFEAR